MTDAKEQKTAYKRTQEVTVWALANKKKNPYSPFFSKSAPYSKIQFENIT